jgi:hypothetical protein
MNSIDGRQPIFLQGIYNETQNKVKTFTNVLFFQFSQGDLDRFQIDQGAFDFQKDLSERFKISITDKVPYLAVVAPEPFKDYRDCTPFAGDINIVARNAILDNKYEDYYLELLTAIGNCTNTNGILLFVNGYRPFPSFEEMTMEKPESDNQITSNDRYGYWKGIDQKFIGVLKPKAEQIWYADGHFSVSTSNHVSLPGFVASLASCAPEELKLTLLALHPTIVTGGYNLSNCYHNSTPYNTDGFTTRKENGMVAGNNLLEKLKQNARINTEGKIIDTIDVVCHSMGFAYAQGLINVLRNKLPFGRFYIIAPENPASGEQLLLTEWQDVWQYGSNETLDPIDKQDGVAQQAPVPGIQGKRAFIPSNAPKSFQDCHSIDNYIWIFDLNIDDDGYVTPRK